MTNKELDQAIAMMVKKLGGATIGDVLASKAPASAPPVLWTGTPPSECQICGGTIGSVFYDFRVPSDGRWGIGCHSCFQAHRGKLGTGRGQKFKRVGKTRAYAKVGG